MDDDELFEELGRSLLGEGSGMGEQDDEHYALFGRKWFKDKLPELRERLCGNKAVKTTAKTSAAVDLATVGDALASMFGHPTFSIVAVLVMRTGLHKLCAGEA